MRNFSKISEALKYIDDNLSENINLELLSDKFYFSPYYFHRLFSAIVGKTLGVYIRDRRILYACKLLCSTNESILDIALDCGFNSAQSFTRAFNEIQGLSPREYRKQGYSPVIISVDEMVMKFTNRLKGGIFVKPNIINQEELIIAGIKGNGNQTCEAWNIFEKLSIEKPITNAISNNGYEIRLYNGDKCTVYVGLSVSDENVDSNYNIIKLPKSKYASFDVYVSNGYDSENTAMHQWLKENDKGYKEKLLNGSHYCIEYYDERFSGEQEGSIVEIWIPIEKA